MTTKRLAVLALILVVGLSAIFTLRRSSANQPTGLRLRDEKPFLPSLVGTWVGEPQEITEKEVKTLGEGTQFARVVYPHPYPRFAGGTRAFTTIVLSGRDIANSLHRPERCLDAQGWNSLGSETIEVAVPGKGNFPVRRLHNYQILRSKSGGPPQQLEAYTYYWYVGEHSLNASHYGRLFTDSRDRILRGVDQRWAYISITAYIPAQLPPGQQEPAREWVDREMRDFIKDLALEIHGDSVAYN